MINLLNDTPTLYDPDKAEVAAKVMNENDDDWQFIAVHDPKGGYSLIKVYDEDLEYIGTL